VPSVPQKPRQKNVSPTPYARKLSSAGARQHGAATCGRRRTVEPVLALGEAQRVPRDVADRGAERDREHDVVDPDVVHPAPDHAAERARDRERVGRVRDEPVERAGERQLKRVETVGLCVQPDKGIA
jgi:hypothetical protein